MHTRGRQAQVKGMAESHSKAEQEENGMAKGTIGPAGPIWDGVTYPRVSPGRYSAVAVRIQGPEWIYRYSRWSLLVEFELLGESESVLICAFFNMGTNRDKPRAGRHSRYFKAWTIANGDLPRRGQQMDPEVFLEGQVYELEVGDNSVDSEERQKTDAEVYSRVMAVKAAIRANQQSLNQESRITQSPNPAINQSSRPASEKPPLKVMKFASAGRR
jgi:hypothetical protein